MIADDPRRSAGGREPGRAELVLLARGEYSGGFADAESGWADGIRCKCGLHLPVLVLEGGTADAQL